MAGSQYKLSKLAQDHIRAIKDYTILPQKHLG